MGVGGHSPLKNGWIGKKQTSSHPSLAPYFLPSLKWIQEKVNVINLDVNRLQ